MNIIKNNKEKLISFLKFLNDKPGFKRVFYWIHEIRKNEFTSNRFIAVRTPEDYWIGVRNFHLHPAWKRMASGDYEPMSVKIVKSFLPHTDTFIDAGAHIGYFTCLVGTQSKNNILSFEPNPKNFEYLNDNIRYNNISTVNAFNIGLAERKQDNILLFGEGSMSSIISQTFAGDPKSSARVSVDILDNYLKYIDKSGSVFLKIDVEGAEFRLLQGSQKLFNEYDVSVVMAEVVKHWSGGDNPNFDKTIKFFTDRGYHVYVIPDFVSSLKKFTGADERVSGNFLFIKPKIISLINQLSLIQ